MHIAPASAACGVAIGDRRRHRLSSSTDSGAQRVARDTPDNEPSSRPETLRWTILGCVATFKKRQESDGSGRAGAVSCNHPEQLVDELNLSPTIRTAHPPRLPLPDHVHGLGSLDRSPRRVECTKALLRRHASFDRSMIRLSDVVHVLDRSVAATASQDSCLFHPRNCRAVETGLVRVDDAGLRMRRISQRLAEQACGRSGIAPPREHEVDRGAAGIDGSVEGAPTALDTNVGLIDTPGLIGWLEMMAQPFLQFGTVALDPVPVWSTSRPRSLSSSATSRNESEYRRYQRTAHKISAGSVCRHLKIAGRIAFFIISLGYQSPPATVATQPATSTVSAQASSTVADAGTKTRHEPPKIGSGRCGSKHTTSPKPRCWST